jgi:hypothetical protein
LHRLKEYSELLTPLLVAGLLAGMSEFALRCHLEQDRMGKTIAFVQHRQRACLELRWRWEADDQEHQYIGSSAGTSVRVGPIAGFVMDVTENEYGHAVGQCHLENEPYINLLSKY